MNITTIRPIVLAILSVLASLGWVSPELAEVVRANSDALIAGLCAAWAIVAYRRNRKETPAPAPAPEAGE